MPRCAKKNPIPLYWIPRHTIAYGWEGPALLVGGPKQIPNLLGDRYDAICFTRTYNYFYFYPAGETYSICLVEEAHYPIPFRMLGQLWGNRGPVSNETLNATAAALGLRTGGELGSILRGLPNLARQLNAQSGIR